MRNKPQTPYDDFPLFPHANGQWVKKIRGKLYHFGSWADWGTALNKYLACRDDLYAGRAPRQVSGDGITVKELCNLFLTTKKILLDAGQLSARTMDDYRKACERVIESFGHGRIVSSLDTIDFERLRKSFPKTWGLVRAGNTIQHIRTIFKFAYDEGHIDRTLRFGQAFRRPDKKSLRKIRHEKGPRLFEACEIRLLLDKASSVLRAMILLGINCGFGNNDCATLTKKFINLKTGWHHYGRPKTGVERRCPLWPETVKAIREASKRKKLNDSNLDELVFITKYGKSWHKETSDNPISNEFAKLLRAVGINRQGANFYALRHTFQTIGEGAKDPVAVSYIMGHAPHGDDMSSIYRERMDDERLQAVTAHVYHWLFGE